MRILLLTQLFQPEPNLLKGLTFAKELVRFGHQVEVLTGFPNYPEGRIYPGSRMRAWSREQLDGIPVTRVVMFPSHDRSGLRRFACYASLALSASLFGPWITFRPDVVHVYQGPATLVLPALIYKLIFKSLFLLDIQDLWPESVFASGMYRLWGGRKLLEWWCRWSYRSAKKIIVLSEGYKRALMQKAVPASKIEVVHNWCDESLLTKPAATFQDRTQLGFGRHFNLVYTGSMGPVQGLDAVLLAAARLQTERPDFRLVMVGGGIDEERLKTLAQKENLTNVKFFPCQPLAQTAKYMAAADALLVHLKKDPLCRIGIPSKIQAYMAMARPILLAAQGDAADLVRKAGAGLACEPGNEASLVAAIGQMMEMPPSQRDQMGQRGREFYLKELSFSVGVRHMERLLCEAADHRPA